MGILYILSVILLGIGFMAFKKSDEKLNFIKWLIIFLVSMYGYNVILGMVLGLLNITSYIWLLSLINIGVGFCISFKSFKNKDLQNYSINKYDIIGICLILTLFTVMFFKDLYILKGNISHMAIDSAIHYRAAKHYADYLKIFVNLEDKSFFDFNVMQTGAYINDGIFMNVIHSFTNIDYCYLYQAFETITLFLSGLAFYAIFIDKMKKIPSLIFSMILIALYMYGYPYNSWFYGFSYLSVGIMFVAMLVPVVELITQNVNKVLVITLIGILSFGLIFSYCLFVPAIFAAICIFVFLKDLKIEGKTILKFFKKDTLIVTSMLLAITCIGIGYLFIPTFFIPGQENLVDALKIDGGIYSEKYANFLAYIPFACLYVFELIKRIKNKSLSYADIFSVCMIGYFVLMYIGLMCGKVSLYYNFKIYFIVWMVIFNVTIDLLNTYDSTKIVKWIMLVYIGAWAGFVCLWVWIKAGHVIGEEEKHALPNYVGMYYSENCEYRKLVDFTQSIKKSQVELTNVAKDYIGDITAENTELITESYYQRIWITALTEMNSNRVGYRKVIQDTSKHSLQNALEDTEKQYVICTAYKENLAYKSELENYLNNENIKLILENDCGYVLEIVR